MEIHLPGSGRADPLPADGLYLNHTSFLRNDPHLQAKFAASTGENAPHYDLQVVLDSYYADGLDDVDHVEWIFDAGYGDGYKPKFASQENEDKFLMKELAYGEFLLLAKVHFKSDRRPVLLQRYITLWNSGPRL